MPYLELWANALDGIGSFTLTGSINTNDKATVTYNSGGFISSGKNNISTNNVQLLHARFNAWASAAVDTIKEGRFDCLKNGFDNLFNLIIGILNITCVDS